MINPNRHKHVITYDGIANFEESPGKTGKISKFSIALVRPVGGKPIALAFYDEPKEVGGVEMFLGMLNVHRDHLSADYAHKEHHIHLAGDRDYTKLYAPYTGKVFSISYGELEGAWKEARGELEKEELEKRVSSIGQQTGTFTLREENININHRMRERLDKGFKLLFSKSTAQPINLLSLLEQPGLIVKRVADYHDYDIEKAISESIVLQAF